MAEPGCPLGGPKCPASICDCFIDQFPSDPLGLHPEAFLVDGHQYDKSGHMATCPGCAVGSDPIGPLLEET